MAKTPILPTPAQYLAQKVRVEYARLKESGVEKIDFRQLMLNVIRGEGINDSTVVRGLMSEISKLFKRWKKERVGDQLRLPLRSPRRQVFMG
jgi:hypothetical protein